MPTSNKELQAHPMRHICETWLSKVDMALKERHLRFGQYAEEATRFFDGNHDWMWQDEYARGSGGFLDKEGGVLPHFRVSVNKLFEAVALYGPSLYSQNPNVLVTPQNRMDISPVALGYDPNDPFAMSEFQQLVQEDQYEDELNRACADLKTRYLTWLQYETDKKTQARRAITEAIVAGIGYLETTVGQPPSGQITMPISRYLSWWDVVVDPDAVYWEEVQWLGIRRIAPVNLAEERFGLTPGDLKGHFQSFAAQATKRGKKEAKQNRKGQSFDLVEYWEIYSKNGFGDKLKQSDQLGTNQQYDYESLGKNCWIVACRGIPYPLNCPTAALTEEDARDLYDRAQWPIKFWDDQNGWPISRLTFYHKPAEVWPISIFKPAIGELRFINWCLSFLADKVASSCVTYMGVLKEAGATIQKQLTGSMSPFSIIEISTALGKPLDQLVSFLQAPTFCVDIWKMIAEVLELIDKRTGVTELLYGMQATQDRSAAATNVKSQNTSIRPDDMASCTEDFLSEVNVREMQAARWFCQPEDILPVAGRRGALLWQNYIMQSDPHDVVMNFNYRIEAGSAKKPNKNNLIAQLTQVGQTSMSVIAQFAVNGEVGPWNAYMTALCKAMDMDAQPFLVQPPQQQGPSPQEQELDAKLQQMELKLDEMAMKMGHQHAEHVQTMTHDRQKHEQDMRLTKEKAAAQKRVKVNGAKR